MMAEYAALFRPAIRAVFQAIGGSVRCAPALSSGGRQRSLPPADCRRCSVAWHLHVDLQRGYRIAAIQLDLYFLALNRHVLGDDGYDLLLQHG
jgi:hypothetical protein